MPRIFSISDWEQYFLAVGLAPELSHKYMQYVETMLSRRFPVIFEFQHLAALLGRTPAYLASVVNCPNKHYREFTIPKRRGGNRTISAPYPALLDCQRWINDQILRRVRVHGAAHGFRRKRTIKTNAENHRGQKCLLKMDLADFFPSIEIRRVIKVFRVAGYPSNVAFYLGQLCCLDGGLPQGAATSPALSNTIAFRLDQRLTGLAKKANVTYTRYADDLTFSGDRIAKGFVGLVNRIVSEEGFRTNHEKTQLCRKPGKRVVTGLSLHDDGLRPTRHFRRSVMQAVYYILRFGYASHVRKMKIRDPFYMDSLYGKLLFWKWVEPENRFVLDACGRLQAMLKESIT